MTRSARILPPASWPGPSHRLQKFSAAPSNSILILISTTCPVDCQVLTLTLVVALTTSRSTSTLQVPTLALSALPHLSPSAGFSTINDTHQRSTILRQTKSLLGTTSISTSTLSKFGLLRFQTTGNLIQRSSLVIEPPIGKV
jgi:hypothetical protein